MSALNASTQHLLWWLICFYLPVASAADDALDKLLRQGTNFQLQGNYAKADEIGEQLKRDFPITGAGHALNLNTLVTRLSWDLTDTQYDAALESEAAASLKLCTKKTRSYPDDAAGYHLCGQAKFALTFLNAARGSYFRGGRNAASTIKNLEQALKRDPELTDAKMHLGITYYYADNLPPFVRAISRFLKFVPTGNSSKSLPYLLEAAESGRYIRDAAKYLYADLVMSSEPDRLAEAGAFLSDLVQRYPMNRRFQFKYINFLVQTEQYDRALQVVSAFTDREKCCPLPEDDLNLAQLWRANIEFAMGKHNLARPSLALVRQEALASWAQDWYDDTNMMLIEEAPR